MLSVFSFISLSSYAQQNLKPHYIILPFVGRPDCI